MIINTQFYKKLKITLEPEFAPNMPPPFFNLIIILEVSQFHFSYSLILLGRVLQGMWDHSDTTKTLCCVAFEICSFFRLDHRRC